MLLLHAGEAVSTDRLIDAVWGERPPASAANALQAHVAVLRRALRTDTRAAEREVLVTRAPGYVVNVEPDALDIARFERLLTEGRRVLSDDPKAAGSMLGEALGLWRGPAQAGFLFVAAPPRRGGGGG